VTDMRRWARLRRWTFTVALTLLFASPLNSQQGYIPFATEFDGSADYYLRGGELTGVSDGKKGLLSFWVRFDGNEGAQSSILRSTSSRLNVHRRTDNTLRFVLTNTAAGTIWLWDTTTTYPNSTSWIHILASWDLGNSFDEVFINDVAESSATTFLNEIIDYTDTDIAIGARPDGLTQLNGAISELYFNTAETLDITVVANRRKFITADFKPVDLGPSGYKPTGTAPLVYLRTQFNGFGQNSGTGGDFTPQDPVTSTAGPVPIMRLGGRVRIRR